MKDEIKHTITAAFTIVTLTALITTWVGEAKKLSSLQAQNAAMQDQVGALMTILNDRATQIKKYEAIQLEQEVIIQQQADTIKALQAQKARVTPIQSWTRETFILTAYDDCEACQGQWVGRTSTGATPTPNRTIAVDPEVIPYGTQVIIDGQIYTAEDCGGAIKGNRIDIFMGSHEEAQQFGKQTQEIIILHQ